MAGGIMGFFTDLKYDLGSRHSIVREIFAEFFGTFIVVVIGTSCVAQAFYVGEPSPTPVAVGYGIAYAMGMYIAGGVTGGHLNPVVSVSYALLGRVTPLRALAYAVAQILGAFIGAACSFGIYYEALKARTLDDARVVPGYDAIWVTYPNPDVNAGTGFGNELLASAILVILMLAITDEDNAAPQLGLRPFLIGLVYAALGIGFAFNVAPGPSANPAKDIGGRIFVAIAGWKGYPFSFREFNWFWIPLVGPLVGGLLGALLYQLLVAIHHPLSEEEMREARERREMRRTMAPPRRTPPDSWHKNYPDYGPGGGAPQYGGYRR